MNNADGSVFRYDELHPSERTSEIVANEFLKVVKGESKYGRKFQG